MTTRRRQRAITPEVRSPARIGSKLRDRRRQLDLTLEALAATTGLTKGFLSEIERDAASPSVASLLAVCNALGLGIGSLFEASASSSVVRTADRTPIQFGGSGLSDHLLSPRSARRLQVILSAMRPGGTGGEEFYSLPAEEEFILVLEGSCSIRIEDTELVLATGDTFTFDPRRPHTFRNASETESALVLFVVTPASY